MIKVTTTEELRKLALKVRGDLLAGKITGTQARKVLREAEAWLKELRRSLREKK